MPLEPTKGSITLDVAKTVTGGALAEDVEGDDSCTINPTFSEEFRRIEIVANTTLATKTLTFDGNSIAFAAGFGNGYQSDGGLKLYMGGVLLQTSANFAAGSDSYTRVVRDFKVLSGSQTCSIKNADDLRMLGASLGSEVPAAIAVGSVKLV